MRWNVRRLLVFLALCCAAAFMCCTFLIPSSSSSLATPVPCGGSSLTSLELPQPEHQLAVLVPFRDRMDELLKFAPHMHQFLSRQNISYKIYVLNQADRYRFNRGSLVNVGFLLSRQDCPRCDYVAIHDVDLLPLNPGLSYGYPGEGPRHISSPQLHPRYHYPTFLGGILLLSNPHFQQVNGFSNRYWGWGLEDDEFHARLRDAGLLISRPQGLTTGPKDTFLHLHDRAVRKRDTAKLFNQKAETRKRDRKTGLSNVRYRISAPDHLMVNGVAVKVFHIHLECDISQTPWCDHRRTTAKPHSSPPPPSH